MKELKGCLERVIYKRVGPLSCLETSNLVGAKNLTAAIIGDLKELKCRMNLQRRMDSQGRYYLQRIGCIRNV